MKRVFFILLLAFTYCQAQGQSKELMLELWECKRQVRLTASSVKVVSEFNQDIKALKESIDKLEHDYYVDNAQSDKVRKQINDLYVKKHQLIDDIKQKATSSSDEAMFLNLMQYVRPNDIRAFLQNDGLDAERVEKYKRWLASIEKNEVGGKLEHLTLTDAKGKEINTVNMKGKIFWIDSWASKCGPCIKKLKQMKPVYEKYHKKGFEIIAVSWDYSLSGYLKSVEEAKEDWQKALKRYQFPWIDVFDEGDQVMQGQLQAVGKNLLINEEGIIIGYDLKPIEIECLLDKLL